MASIRQKKLAKAAIDNLQADKPLNKQQLVASVGYSEASAEKKATEILESKGVQQELRKLGFDEETAKEVVGEILLGGDSDLSRLKAADMVFKVNGTYAPEKNLNINVDVESTQRSRELGTRLLGLLGRRN